jgi:hypothetical protein
MIEKELLRMLLQSTAAFNLRSITEKRKIRTAFMYFR